MSNPTPDANRSTSTPGPWRACPPERAGGGKVFSIVRSEATGPSGNVCVYVALNDDLRQTEADAHLIAAAPELLAACQAAVAAISHNADSGKSDCDCDGDCEVAFALWTEAGTLLEAAIARATGGGHE